MPWQRGHNQASRDGLHFLWTVSKSLRVISSFSWDGTWPPLHEVCGWTSGHSSSWSLWSVCAANGLVISMPRMGGPRDFSQGSQALTHVYLLWDTFGLLLKVWAPLGTAGIGAQVLLLRDTILSLSTPHQESGDSSLPLVVTSNSWTKSQLGFFIPIFCITFCYFGSETYYDVNAIVRHWRAYTRKGLSIKMQAGLMDSGSAWVSSYGDVANPPWRTREVQENLTDLMYHPCQLAGIQSFPPTSQSATPSSFIWGLVERPNHQIWAWFSPYLLHETCRRWRTSVLPWSVRLSKHVLNGTFRVPRNGRRRNERSLMFNGHSQARRLSGHRVQIEV